ncbi:MAG: DUF3108 domain-containing protein [Candidatus Eisenbacteria bacterium]|nr:DUF3108 domain-containing protein [Candidatus Eisenbacteria bacterium]
MPAESRRSAAVIRAVLCVTAVLAALLRHVPTRVPDALASPYSAIGPSGQVAEPPFGAGERLTFEIKYGFVTAGTAVMSIPSIVRERGHPCYHIVSIAESNPVFAAFFTVRDVAESFLDVRRLVPLRFQKQIREGDFRSEDQVIFDRDRQVALYPRKGHVVPLSYEAQDILSSLYYVRMMDLRVGRSVYIENHADRKNYPLEIRVLREERVKVPAGAFDCIVVEPVMRTTGLFRHKGKLTVWLTKDPLHVPVLMKSKVAIGSISAVLTKLEPAVGRRVAG